MFVQICNCEQFKMHLYYKNTQYSIVFLRKTKFYFKTRISIVKYQVLFSRIDTLSMFNIIRYRVIILLVIYYFISKEIFMHCKK